MTLGELKAKMVIGVNRSDLSSASDSYADYVNQALKEIQVLRSFACMKDMASVSVSGGASTVALPADFKELQASRTPVYLISTSNESTRRPVDILNRDQTNRYRPWHTSITDQTHIKLYLEIEDLVLRLAAPDTFSEALTFEIHYYKYLPELEDDEDTNYFTLTHPEMVLAKAKESAFQDINDPASEDHAAIFGRKFKAASTSDAYRQLSGRVIRM